MIPIILESAARVGAPLMKQLLEKAVGKEASSIGGAIIDAVALKAGVEPADLADQPGARIDEAVNSLEGSPLMVALLEAQRAGNELQLAEISSGSWFMAAWRPALMWLMGLVLIWYIIALPLVSALLQALGATARVEPPPMGDVMQIFMFIAGLYMGGHTVKELATNRWGAK